MNRQGFTIVELLIVIVVIAILAAISVVAYNGIQARAQVSKSVSDLAELNKIIKLYHAEYGSFPLSPSWRWSNQHPTDYVPGIVPSVTQGLPVWRLERVQCSA